MNPHDQDPDDEEFDDIEDGEENEEQEAQLQEEKEISVEEIRRRLMSRHGFEEDEIDKLLSSEKDLRDFYADVTKKLANADEEGEDWEDAAYVLPSDLEKKMKVKKERREELKKKKEEAAAKLKADLTKAGAKVTTTSELKKKKKEKETPKKEKTSDLKSAASSELDSWRKQIEEGLSADWSEDLPNN